MPRNYPTAGAKGRENGPRCSGSSRGEASARAPYNMSPISVHENSPAKKITSHFTWSAPSSFRVITCNFASRILSMYGRALPFSRSCEASEHARRAKSRQSGGTLREIRPVKLNFQFAELKGPAFIRNKGTSLFEDTEFYDHQFITVSSCQEIR